jgi:hypothetical protein
MSLLAQLSFQSGDRTEAANRRVAAECLADSARLPEIAAGLSSADAALVGDCAEVLTKVAERQPALVAPYAQALARLLGHKTTRVRWEATHALALIAPLAADATAALLPTYQSLIASDASTIVRDYAVDAVGAYAGTSRAAAEAAYPILQAALAAWSGKHAARALQGLAHVAVAAPELRGQVMLLAADYMAHSRVSVRKAAKSVARAAGAERPRSEKELP